VCLRARFRLGPVPVCVCVRRAWDGMALTPARAGPAIGGDFFPPTRDDAVAAAAAAALEARLPEDSAGAAAAAAAAATRAKKERRVARAMRAVYMFLSDPTSSKGAFYYSVYMNLLILFSTAAFCVQTIPSLSNSPEDARQWWMIEIFVMSQFTVEYVVRLVCAPNKRAFVVSPMNMVDLVAILPFYLELIIVAIYGAGSLSIVAVIRIIRLVRIFRLFKLGQHSRQVRMVARAFARSRDGIFLLVFMLGLAVTFFSTLMFFAETASCTLVNDVWVYNENTARPGEPSQYQVRPCPHPVSYTMRVCERKRDT
jgi:hypothetical protein